MIDKLGTALKGNPQGGGPLGDLVDVEKEISRLSKDRDATTRDIARGLKVAKAIKSGIWHVNGPTVHDEAQMPFGGVKSSGYGSFGGKAAIEHFTQLRWVTLQNGPRHYPI